MDPIYAVNGTYETYRPMSYTSWRAENLLVPDSLSADHTVALIGEAESGRPGQQYLVTNLLQAQEIFRSGPLLDAISLALMTGDVSAPRIRAVNVRPGSRSSYVLKDDADRLFGTLYRNAWRERANQTNITLSGDASKGYTVTLRDADNGMVLGSNNIGLGLRLQYQGHGTAATVSITDDGPTRTLRTQVTGANVSENLAIPLTPGMTVATLCERIARSGPYNAYPARDSQLDASLLDATSAPVSIAQYNALGTTTAVTPAGAAKLTLSAPVTIASGKYVRLQAEAGMWFVVRVTANVNASADVPVEVLPMSVRAGTVFVGETLPAAGLSALVGDFSLFFGSRGEGSFEFVPGVSNAGAPAATSGYFTGGASDVTTFADWMSGLDAVSDKPVAVVCPVTDNQAVVAAFRSQISALNAPDNARFLQLIAGYDTARLPLDGASEAEVDAYIREVGGETSAANTRDSVMVVNTQSFQLAGYGRRRVSLPLMAAHIAGLAAAYGPDRSLTYARTGGTGAFPAMTREQTNQVARMGGLCIETVGEDGTSRIVRDRTTYVGASNAVYESGYGTRKMNTIARGAKTIQDRHIPGANGRVSLARYRAELENYYEGLADRQWIEDGVLNGKKVDAYNIAVLPTGSGGRYVKTQTRVNLILEMLVGDQEIVAATAEFEL